MLGSMVALVVCVSGLEAQQAQPATPRPPRESSTNFPDHPSPPQPQQRQSLDYFVGSWATSWTGRESQVSAGPWSGTVTFERLGDSAFLAMGVDSTVEGGGPYRSTGLLGWNDSRKVLTLLERPMAGVELLSLGDWTSPIAVRFDTSPVRVNGQLVRLRRVWSIVSADTFTVAEELSVDGGPFVRLGAGDFRRTTPVGGPRAR